jgi:prepilin-type N-terminal cleavage/methylation domain-containing protein
VTTRSRDAGFSLIELQVALMLGAIFAVAIFGFFRIGFLLYQSGGDRIDTGEAAATIDLIASQIRASSRSRDAVRIWTVGNGDDRHDVLALESIASPWDGAEDAGWHPQAPGWIVYIQDPQQHALRRLSVPAIGENPPAPWEGQFIAGQIDRFAVNRHGDVFDVMMRFEHNGKFLTLATSIRPRNW